MEARNTDFIKVAQQTVEAFYQGKFLPHCEDELECIVPASYRSCVQSHMDTSPQMLSRGTCDIIHNKYKLMLLTSNAIVVSGSYFVVKKKKSGRRTKELLYVTVVMRAASSGIKVAHMHISNAVGGEFYQLSDVSDRQYRIHESEILYLEASHNHILWHCESVKAETVGCFKETEKTLSDEFVRIHRGFIVNRKHISKIARCYVELDNGEILQIPVKRYCEVKKQLQNESEIIKK